MAVSNRQNPAAEPRTGEISVFDQEYFTQQTFGEADLQREIIALFIAQVDDARKTLATPMTSTSWRFLTHTLKGAATAIGANRLAELAAQWELQGTPKDEVERATLLAVFNHETVLFRKAVQGD